MSREKGSFAVSSKCFAFKFSPCRDIIITTFHFSGETMMNIIEIDSSTYCLSFCGDRDFCDFSLLSDEIFSAFGKKLSEKSKITAYKRGGHFLVFISDEGFDARISHYIRTLCS